MEFLQSYLLNWHLSLEYMISTCIFNKINIACEKCEYKNEVFLQNELEGIPLTLSIKLTSILWTRDLQIFF
jgi:hypothetical protein